jgi:2-oxoglutarate dehydrogenase E1 component
MSFPLLLSRSLRLRGLKTYSKHRISISSNNNHNFWRCLSTTAPATAETFLTGTTSVYAEQMYELYQQDPTLVHVSWRKYFDNLAQDIAYDPNEYASPSAALSPQSPFKSSDELAAPSDSLAVSHLIRAYQVNGHFAANLDPLHLYSPQAFPKRPKPDGVDGYPPELTIEYHGFTAADWDRRLYFKGHSSGGNKGFLEELSAKPEKVTLRKIVDALRKTYCGTLGVEYMHIGNVDQMNWIRERVENPRWTRYDKEKKQHIYERLAFADTVSAKRSFKKRDGSKSNGMRRRRRKVMAETNN